VAAEKLQNQILSEGGGRKKRVPSGKRGGGLLYTPHPTYVS